MKSLNALAGRSAASFRRTALAAMTGGAFAVAALSPVQSALAATEGTVKKLTLNLTSQGPGIRVVSSDGQKWTHIEDTTLQFAAGVEIKMGTIGKIRMWGIYWGACNGDSCFQAFGTPLLHSHYVPNGADEFNSNFTLSFAAGKIPFSTPTGIAPTPYGDQAIAQCNEKLSQGKGIHDTHVFSHSVPMTIGVDTYAGLGFQDPPPAGAPGEPTPLFDVDADKTAWVEVPVTCVAVPVPGGSHAVGQVSTQLPPFELLAATLHGHPAEYAGACPINLQLFMSAVSNLPGPFEARIEAKSGWKSKKYVYQTSESNADGTWSKHFQNTLTVPVALPVNQPSGGGAIDAAKGIGNVQMNPKSEEPVVPPGLPKGPKQVQTGFNPGNLHEDSLRLRVKGGDKTIVTDWWTYKVTCDPKKNPAVADAPKGLGQTIFVEQAFLALFPVAPKDGSKCGLNVSGLIQTNVKNVNVTFRLRNHQGNATNSQTIKTSHANNIGKFVEYLDFSKSGQGVWVTPSGGWALPGGGAGSQAGPKVGSLQIVAETPAKFEGNVASYDFTCYDPAPVGLKPPPTVKVDPDVSTPGGLVGRRPVKPASAGRQIAPLPKISCAGGSVRGGKCLCARGFNVVPAGAKAFRCVRSVTLPKIKTLSKFKSPAARRVPLRRVPLRSGRAPAPVRAR